MNVKLLLGLITAFLISACASVNQNKNITRNIASPKGSSTRGEGDFGNGGGACVCRSSQDKTKITYAELIDFIVAEKEITPQIEIQQSNKVKSENILANLYADENLPKLGRTAIQNEINNFKTEFYKSSFIDLKKTPDSHYEVNCNLALKEKHKNNCRYEQVANYTDEGGLIVKKDIFDAFSESDKAGLMLHEALYSLDRKLNKAEWSDDTRLRVGSYFAGDLKQLNDFLSTIKPGQLLLPYTLNDKDSIKKIPRGVILRLKDNVNLELGPVHYEKNGTVYGRNNVGISYMTGKTFMLNVDALVEIGTPVCVLYYDFANWNDMKIKLNNKEYGNSIVFKLVDKDEYRVHYNLMLENVNSSKLPKIWGINCVHKDLDSDFYDKVLKIDEFKKSVGQFFDYYIDQTDPIKK